MRLTAAGEIMADRARRIFDDLKHTLMSVQPHPDDVTGTVAVGLLESTAHLLGPLLVAALRRNHPGIDLRLTVASSDHLEEWLDNGDLDVTLLDSAHNTPAINSHPVVRDNLWAVAPPTAGLRPDTPVPFAHAARQPLVLPSSGHALRTLIDHAAATADVAIDTVVETNSLHMQKRLVLAGLGWTVLPGVAVTEDLADGSLSAAPLCEPDIRRSLVVARQPSARTPSAVRVVTATLVRLSRTAMREGHWHPHYHTPHPKTDPRPLPT